MRKIVIKYPKNRLNEIKRIVNPLNNEFKKRNTKVIYILSTDFIALLYGYDGKVKSRTKIPDNIAKFIFID